VTCQKPRCARSDKTAGKTIVVGILGSVASGKSTVARLMVERGAALIDADRIAHEVLERPEVKDKLTETLGEGILTPEGTVDRPAVARMVFGHGVAEELRKRLDAIVHPPVLAAIQEQVRLARKRRDALAVLDAPLLMEKGLQKHCDVLVFVDAPDALRQERVRERRGWDADELRRRDAAQMPSSLKRQEADITIQNSGGEKELRETVRMLVSRIKQDFNK